MLCCRNANNSNITEALCAVMLALVLKKGSTELDTGMRIGFQRSEGVSWLNEKRNGTGS
jgi:hypothetical protein